MTPGLEQIVATHQESRAAQDAMYRLAVERSRLIRDELARDGGASAVEISLALGVSRARVYAMAGEA